MTYCLNCGQPFELPESLLPPEKFSPQVAWSSILEHPTAPTKSAPSTPDSAQDSVQDQRSMAAHRLQSIVKQDRDEYMLESLLEQSLSTLGLESQQTSLEGHKDSGHLSQASSGPTENVESSLDTPPAKESSNPVNEILSRASQTEPLSMPRAAAVNPDANKFLTPQKLLCMAQSSGIRINFATFRSWQKVGLLPSTVSKQSKDSLKNIKYYSLDTLFRLYFIQQGLEQYHLSLEIIRLELGRLDQKNDGHPSSQNYLSRLEKLGTVRLPSFDPGLLYLIAQHLNINIDEIEEIIIYRKNRPLVEIKGITDLPA